jgi:hypothetical protein
VAPGVVAVERPAELDLDRGDSADPVEAVETLRIHGPGHGMDAPLVGEAISHIGMIGKYAIAATSPAPAANRPQ